MTKLKMTFKEALMTGEKNKEGNRFPLNEIDTENIDKDKRETN